MYWPLCAVQAPALGQCSQVYRQNYAPGGFLQVTETSSEHCLTHQWNALGKGASYGLRCWNNRNSVMEPVWVSGYTAHTCTPSPPNSPWWTKLQGHCYILVTCMSAESHLIILRSCSSISAMCCVIHRNYRHFSASHLYHLNKYVVLFTLLPNIVVWSASFSGHWNIWDLEGLFQMYTFSVLMWQDLPTEI
jgi:hypothetical protein